MCGNGSPFISHASSVFSSSAFATGTLLRKSGVAGLAPAVRAVEGDLDALPFSVPPCSARRAGARPSSARCRPRRSPIRRRARADRKGRAGCRCTGRRRPVRPASKPLLQFVERIFERRVERRTADLEPPGRRIDLGNVRQVPAHEERAVGRDRLVEILDRRFVIWRPVGALDQRHLARQRFEDAGCRWRPPAGRRPAPRASTATEPVPPALANRNDLRSMCTLPEMWPEHALASRYC